MKLRITIECKKLLAIKSYKENINLEAFNEENKHSETSKQQTE